MTWRLFVDTGGTFTDCVAIDPRGGAHRVKVLSTARLRGRIVELADRLAPRVQMGAHLADDVPRGFGVARPGFDPANLVTGFDAASGRVALRAPIDAAFRAGDAFELVAPFESPVLAARMVTRTPGDRPLPPIAMRLATTRATNALLQRRGATVAMVLTRGFGDALLIGDQRRPALFARRIVKPRPLAMAIIEVDERIDARGCIVRALADAEIDRVVEAVVASAADSVAVSLVHAWRNPEHERRLVAALTARCGARIVGGAALGPTIGFLARTRTAEIDASIGPILSQHLDDVAQAIGAAMTHGQDGTDAPDGRHRPAPLLVMTSDGGLAGVDTFVPKDGLLSGPAGGVLGAAAAARRSGFARAIGFDMGGTSTDVARIDGGPMRSIGHRVGDAEVAAPAVAIETVAAGGGSVCAVERGDLVVGPASAGARPGPACYGLGGPLTLTDVNLLLGRVDASRFEFELDRTAAEHAASRIMADGAAAGRTFTSQEDLLEALVALADERMAEAIAAVSVRQGVDPRDHALIAFGGAGGLHACGVAERLGVATVVLPPDAGLLSAVGLANAGVRRVAVRPVLETLESDRIGVAHEAIAAAAAEANGLLARETDAPAAPVRHHVTIRARLLGQETCIDLQLGVNLMAPSRDAIVDRFAAAYRTLYGSDPGPRAIEIESVVVAAERLDEPIVLPPLRGSAMRTTERQTALAWSNGGWRAAACIDVETLSAHEAIDGPALLRQPHGSAWLPPGWTATLDEHAAVIMRRGGGSTTHEAEHRLAASLAGGARDEIVAARLTAIATEMGELLRRTAVSTNVKERLDFSCGVLDRDGQLVVNAPHVPVHLGALGVCVRACDAAIAMGPGDVVVTNHPGFGGSHLPDLTVIAPVFAGGLDGDPPGVRARPGARIGFVAARAHHAEIGGISPGSMPPEATTLADEAVVIAPTHLMRRGAARWDAIEALLGNATHPSRAVLDNIADLHAALAACLDGAAKLAKVAEAIGVDELHRATERLAEYAERSARAALARLHPGRREATERLDDGTLLAVTIDRDDDGDGPTVRIDFTGSSGVHPGNFNATEAIVRSAVMYVLRLMADEATTSDGSGHAAPGTTSGMPAGTFIGGLNEGLLRPVSLHIPFGILSPRFVDDASRCPAVGAGNTETSQRLVDLLLKAFGVVAASQGTMNNLLFGQEAGQGRGGQGRDGRDADRGGFGYYETIGGGSGAGPGFDGADAVHVHMTNTRITDVEILEHRHPVRLERFAVRRGSGGRPPSGLGWRGGDGIVREITFLDAMRLSLVTQRRRSAPFGMPHDGGCDGAPGVNTLVRADGTTVDLGPSASIDVLAGDRLTVETPGGGGWVDRDSTVLIPNS